MFIHWTVDCLTQEMQRPFSSQLLCARQSLVLSANLINGSNSLRLDRALVLCCFRFANRSLSSFLAVYNQVGSTVCPRFLSSPVLLEANASVDPVVKRVSSCLKLLNLLEIYRTCLACFHSCCLLRFSSFLLEKDVIVYTIIRLICGFFLLILRAHGHL